MNAKQYKAYQQAVEHNLRGLSFISTGACPGCDECGLSDEPTEDEVELAGEPHFSWSACECCGSRLGGDREPAHARDKNNTLIHFSVCVDCLYYLNYGRLDDSSMLEIESEKP